MFTPKMPKITRKHFGMMFKAVLQLQLTGVLRYILRGALVVKNAAELPKLADGRVNSAEVLRSLWQDAVDAKAPGKGWKVTAEHVRQRVKKMAKDWEAVHVTLPIPADAPAGTVPTIVGPVKDGKYRDKTTKQIVALPEGCQPAQFYEVYGLEIVSETDPFAELTGFEELDDTEIDFGDFGV